MPCPTLRWPVPYWDALPILRSPVPHWDALSDIVIPSYWPCLAVTPLSSPLHKSWNLSKIEAKFCVFLRSLNPNFYILTLTFLTFLSPLPHHISSVIVLFYPHILYFDRTFPSCFPHLPTSSFTIYPHFLCLHPLPTEKSARAIFVIFIYRCWASNNLNDRQKLFPCKFLYYIHTISQIFVTFVKAFQYFCEA